jgi:HEAT repeat protein
MLRVRGALALANAGDGSGVPVLAEALDHCDDVLLCRLIILALGKLGDARAVPALLAHLSEVQNRREMVDALGDIGAPAAVPALVERLAGDEYVPVRVQAARALAKIAKVDPSEAADKDIATALDHAAHHDTERTVVAAAKQAAADLRSHSPPVDSRSQAR